MRSPPLTELYDLLRADGFAIGVDDHLRIGRLLARDAPWTPEMLRIAVAALVVTCSDEERAFDVCWELWMSSVERPGPAEFVQPTDPVPELNRSRWVIAIVGGIAIGVAGFLIVRSRLDGGSHTQRIDAAVASQPALGALGSGGFSSNDAQGKLVTDVGLDADHGSSPASPTQHTSIDVTLVVLALGTIILVISTLAFVRGARARRRFVCGPWAYTLAVPPATKPVLLPTAIEDAAAALTWRAQEGEQELDLDRSVAATVARDGLPTLVYRRSLGPLRYLVLEDASGGTASCRFVYDELLRGLVREGLEIERYTFAASLEQCAGPDGHEIAIGELLDRADALIAIGNGDAAIDALTDDRAVWLAQLRLLPRRVWINPLPPARWSAGAHAIAADTPMEHGAAGALVAFRAGIDRRVHRASTYPPVIERTPGTASAIVALRVAIGDRAFRLVAAVAAAGPPTISLARWLVETCSLEMDEQDWLCVATLPWFRSEQWPAGLPERLSAELRADQPDLARFVAALADRLFSASEPPRGSGAYLAWQLDGAYHACGRGERAVAARVLSQITRTPLAYQARSALAALGLRDRRRAVTMTAITVGAVLFAVASGSSIVDARLRSIALARRVAERHLEKVAGDGARLAKPTGESWPEAFAVRVVDGNGKPVSGARVVWSNPQLGPRSHSGTTDAAGLSRATQIYPSEPRNDLEQVAQLIGKAFMDIPVFADGERVVLRFSQIGANATPSGDPATVVEPAITTKFVVEIKPETAGANAKVFIDGKPMEGTTADIALDPGTAKKHVKVLITTPGYKDVEQEFDVEGESTTLKVELWRAGRSKPRERQGERSKPIDK